MSINLYISFNLFIVFIIISPVQIVSIPLAIDQNFKQLIKLSFYLIAFQWPPLLKNLIVMTSMYAAPSDGRNARDSAEDH